MRRTILCLVLMLLTLTALPALSDPLRVVGDRDFAPYSMMQGDKPAGIDVEMFQEAAKRTNIEYTLELLPWDELVQAVKSGSCDVAFSMFKASERSEYAIFADSSPMHTSDYVMFTRQNRTFTFNDWTDLMGKRIGVIRGFCFCEEFDQAAAQGKVEKVEFENDRAGLGGLLKRQVDGFIGQLDTSYYQINKMGLSSTIVYLPKIVREDRPAYMVVSRASAVEHKQQLADRLGMALKSMYRDGTYSTIARRYLFRF